MDYKKYLLSYSWKKKKKQLFDLRGKECEQCGSINRIQVHHLTYERLGNEKMEDLQILCYQCHMSKHDKYFKKYVLKKPIHKKRKRKKRGFKPKRKKQNNIPFNEMTVGQKRKHLRQKGWDI